MQDQSHSCERTNSRGTPSRQIANDLGHFLISADTPIAVVDAVRRLSTRQAEVVGLHYFADLPIRDIAVAIGCSEETVRTHLKRARARLARTLGDLT